jgi:tetratricopeptide (TPR) repeat protein
MEALMRNWVLGVVVCLLGLPLAAQRQKVNINTETPEGQLLQQIGQEEDAAKKAALMEQFVGQYPKHDSIAWVYSNMIDAYTKTNQPAKAMEAADKLLAIDPGDSRAAHAALKAAEAAKDPDAVKAWAVRAGDAARKAVQAPKPADAEEEEDWKAEVDFAKQVETYTEYSLYAAALQATDSKKKIELLNTLEGRSPNSQYLAQAYGPVFVAMQQAGDTANAVIIAEKVLAKDQNNEDMLLVVANHLMSQKQDPDKVLAYAARMVELMATKPKPEGVADADWDKKKATISGLGHWIAGMTHYNQNRFAPADKSFRAALPFIQGNDQLLAPALFHLGVSNYRLKNILEAIQFNEKCAAIKGSPYAAAAAKNLRAIRSEYRVVK